MLKTPQVLLTLALCALSITAYSSDHSHSTLRKRSPVVIEALDAQSDIDHLRNLAKQVEIPSDEDTFSMSESDIESESGWETALGYVKDEANLKFHLDMIWEDLDALQDAILAISRRRSIRNAHPRDIPGLEWNLISSLVFGTYIKLPPVKDLELQAMKMNYDFYLGHMGHIMYKQALKKKRNDWNTLSNDQKRGVRIMANAALRTLEDVKDRCMFLARQARFMEYESRAIRSDQHRNLVHT